MLIVGAVERCQHVHYDWEVEEGDACESAAEGEAEAVALAAAVALRLRRELGHPGLLKAAPVPLLLMPRVRHRPALLRILLGAQPQQLQRRRFARTVTVQARLRPSHPTHPTRAPLGQMLNEKRARRKVMLHTIAKRSGVGAQQANECNLATCGVAP